MAKINIKCDECGKSFEKERSEYNRRIKKGYTKFFCDSQCAGKGLDRPNEIHVPITVQCLWCKSVVETTTNPKAKKCCSRTCSAKYSRSKCLIETFKKTVSDKIKSAWETGKYDHTLATTERDGRKQYFNSKGEIELRNYLKSTFPNYKFTTGMVQKTQEGRINPDIWSREYKVMIEYDGIWHFEDIMGQLEDKQRKDKLVEEWCIKNGWRCIRIKEDVYKKNKEEYKAKLKSEIINGTAPIVRYY
jgi:very-short-patch-repair endonuclease